MEKHRGEKLPIAISKGYKTCNDSRMTGKTFPTPFCYNKKLNHGTYPVYKK
jgi:hypothetical protein